MPTAKLTINAGVIVLSKELTQQRIRVYIAIRNVRGIKECPSAFNGRASDIPWSHFLRGFL